jgi:regulator of cell morphogenesis and NO signaling
MLNTQTTVGDFVAWRPGLSRVFRDRGIDFCCGGKRSLADVCQEKGLDAGSLLQTLLASPPAPADGPCLTDLSLTSLCDLIEKTHHAYVKAELPRLSELAGKVAKAHGSNHPEMRQVHQLFLAVREELESHLAKEERILFPAIRGLEAGDAMACGHCGSVSNPIRVMEMEHDSAGAALEQLRRLTGNFTPPADACGSFRALLDGWREFEENLHQHVHKENNILFPRAVVLETRLRHAP